MSTGITIIVLTTLVEVECAKSLVEVVCAKSPRGGSDPLPMAWLARRPRGTRRVTAPKGLGRGTDLATEGAGMMRDTQTTRSVEFRLRSFSDNHRVDKDLRSEPACPIIIVYFSAKLET